MPQFKSHNNTSFTVVT